MFSKKKIEKIKKLKASKITGKIISILGDEIIEAVKNGSELKAIAEYLEEEIGKPVSYNYLKQWISKAKKKGEKMERNVILIANDKGGVGKTTISSLLNLPNQVIINLDKTRKISEIFPYKEVVDFEIFKEEHSIGSIEELLNLLLSEQSKYENIILDTKGGITNELLEVIPYITHIIIPVKMGSISEIPTYEFIVSLKNYIDKVKEKNLKWAIVFNEVSPKFLEKVGLKYELGENLKAIAKELKEELLKDDLKVATYLKRSEAITTREYKKKDFDELQQENPVAYLAIINELDRFNKDIKKMFAK